MKRPRAWLGQLIVFVLLLVGGAIVNVAVAWGCPHVWKPDWRFPQWSDDDLLYTCTCAVYHVGPMLCEVNTGWPFHSLHASWVGGRQDGYSMVFTVPGMTVMPDVVTTLVEPLHPIWPGFAINTIFYAAILWLLFAAPLALRRYVGGRRIKRGLCPACAYPIGSNHICTECGSSLPQRSRDDV